MEVKKTEAHQKIAEKVGKGKTVLDIGCGDGTLAKRLAKNDCIVTGIERDYEKSIQAATVCKRVIRADIEKSKILISEKYDVIILADVLEHINNPIEVLIQAKQMLKEEGYIIISIPNIVNWKIRIKILLGHFDYTKQGILDKTHIRFYTKKTIKETIKESGLRIEEIDWIESFPFPKFKRRLSKISTELFSFQFILKVKK